MSRIAAPEMAARRGRGMFGNTSGQRPRDRAAAGQRYVGRCSVQRARARCQRRS